ncbi:unnamed protein product [Phyllotreta striolata]|uniref:Uncharacterized protein n=1 Tax=Phyllotreta striolata TaxID=444603 RepID=A0A9N9TTA2_PHYSR|nr:unnamed protein product [Phyllotreta striolata]
MLNNNAIMEMCETLAAQENLRVTVSESLKCGFIGGCGALAGGLLSGPIGVAIGGSVASIASAWLSRNNFKSLVDVLREDLSHAQKEKLTDCLSRALANIKPEDYLQLATLVLTSASLKEVVIKELGCFLLKELNLKMIQ